ncbi:MAG: 50S ribosomal protein L18 [Thermoanaerobaculia bacterium]
MDRAKARVESRGRIRERIRGKVAGSAERPRLAVFKSLKYIYVQVIDDSTGRTIASASSLEKDLRTKVSGSNKGAAAAVGELIAERVKEKGLSKVVFDRGGYQYHGNVKALAEAARSKGLVF